jgi:hypothetical protein
MPIPVSSVLSEFLVADLSLAAHAISSFTLSSPSLLSAVLENHPPSAIITTLEFLPHVLALIYNSAEHGHHTVIVTGGADLEGTTEAKNVNILRFTDIETAGANGDKIVTQPPPSQFLNLVINASYILTTDLPQAPTMCLPFLSSTLTRDTFKLPSSLTKISPLVLQLFAQCSHYQVPSLHLTPSFRLILSVLRTVGPLRTRLCPKAPILQLSIVQGFIIRPTNVSIFNVLI